MLNNIFFLGGIHGSGKTTIGKILAKKLGIEYLSASSLIKWEEKNVDKLNKRVLDINKTQKLLLKILHKKIDTKKLYILDGHYCLINNLNQITPIPFNVFKEINPLCLILLDEPFVTVKNRLIKRNHNPEFIEIVNELAKHEYEYAYKLSQEIGKRTYKINSHNIDFVKSYLSHKMSSINI